MPIFNLGKLRLKHQKKTSNLESVRVPCPPMVTIPMSQHIGAAARPVVKVGDRVLVGTVIGEADGKISAPIHSSISGTVKKIDLNYTLHNGSTCPLVTIESDGLMEVDPAVAPKTVTNASELEAAVRESGSVGLGGAGFPTSVKLAAESVGAVDTLVVNAAECEPYITSDTRAIIEDGEILIAGIKRILSLTGIQRAIIGVEANNSDAIKALNGLTGGEELISVKVLSAKYPQGAEKVLVYNTTKRVVEEGAFPASVGVLVLNVSTLIFVEKYIRTGMPLVEKRVTVDGSAVASPANLIIPIGTSIK